ncbi:hypothetical protein CAPTEDRAFT_130300, partial [Capitella teleta]
AGFVWVTADRAALWTDGRYFLQAEQQLDCQWIIMQQGEDGYPSAGDWLLSVLSSGDRVGSDPRYVSISEWTSYSSVLEENNISMVEVADLFDEIWTEDRPERPNSPLIIHTLEYSGEQLSNKIERIRAELNADNSDALVLTALDDTAWTFNLRGSDRETSAMFYSYAIITPTDATLYLSNYTALIAPADVRSHLNTGTDGSCSEVKEYDEIITDLEALAAESGVNKIWLSPSSNYATFSAISGKEKLEASPTQLMKSVKNEVERRRYKECQIRDSAALSRFAAFLEKEVDAGNTWTEVSAAQKLLEIRQCDPAFHSVSFLTISAVGPNAAVIHYRASEATDKQINTDDVYLLDSGGQYLDGTTDVTRTFHYGTPSDIVKEAYTRVLMGAIELSLTVWPFGLHGTEIDIRARAPLYEHGWDYRHGTGHGIGYFLNVHEGPGTIRMGWSEDHAALQEGMFFSDEPGYYEDGSFGIRLETIVGVEKADTPNHFGDDEYLTFEEVTYVPFEPKLIKYELLDIKHRHWLNDYHAKCIERTGALLLDGGHQEAYDWLVARSQPIEDEPNWTNSGPASTPLVQLSVVIFSLLMALF